MNSLPFDISRFPMPRGGFPERDKICLCFFVYISTLHLKKIVEPGDKNSIHWASIAVGVTLFCYSGVVMELRRVTFGKQKNIRYKINQLFFNIYIYIGYIFVRNHMG